jgi:hypothetical protein
MDGVVDFGPRADSVIGSQTAFIPETSFEVAIGETLCVTFTLGDGDFNANVARARVHSTEVEACNIGNTMPKETEAYESTKPKLSRTKKRGRIGHLQ